MAEMINEQTLIEIARLANVVPEEFRQKAFELLLSNTLQAETHPNGNGATPPSNSTAVIDSTSLPIDVKAFFSQYRLDLNLLSRLFHQEGGEVRPIYRLNENTKVKAELNHTLLMSLENAIRSGQFQVDIEALRNRCQEQKCYDMANFMRHLRKNYRLFKSISPNEPLILSAEGKAQLASLLRRLEVHGVG